MAPAHAFVEREQAEAHCAHARHPGMSSASLARGPPAAALAWQRRAEQCSSSSQVASSSSRRPPQLSASLLGHRGGRQCSRQRLPSAGARAPRQSGAGPSSVSTSGAPTRAATRCRAIYNSTDSVLSNHMDSEPATPVRALPVRPRQREGERWKQAEEGSLGPRHACMTFISASFRFFSSVQASCGVVRHRRRRFVTPQRMHSPPLRRASRSG